MWQTFYIDGRITSITQRNSVNKSIQGMGPDRDVMMPFITWSDSSFLLRRLWSIFGGVIFCDPWHTLWKLRPIIARQSKNIDQ